MSSCRLLLILLVSLVSRYLDARMHNIFIVIVVAALSVCLATKYRAKYYKVKK